jgi:hypothetical protein
MRYEVTTTLTPREASERASARFGPQGAGLEITGRDEGGIVFEGGGGYVARMVGGAAYSPDAPPDGVYRCTASRPRPDPCRSARAPRQGHLPRSGAHHSPRAYALNPVSPLPSELPKAFQVFGGLHMPPANSVGDVPDVEVAVRVHCHAVRRDELCWALAFLGCAKPRL